MSQLKISANADSSALLFSSASAVRMAPRVPSPGHWSRIVSKFSAGSLAVCETIFALEVTVATSLAVRARIVWPANSARALSVPKRELAPQASTYPKTVGSVLHATRLPPPSVPGQGVESQVRAISPANFGGANQSLRQCAKHSNGDSKVVW